MLDSNNIDEISDQEALDWLNKHCLSITIGNDLQQYIGSWRNQKNQNITITAKQAMLRIAQAVKEKQENESKYKSN